MHKLELWAGPECTVNRVGDQWHDQLARSGFDRRLDDIDRLAGLGITRLRFPLLWERTERAPGQYDWAWADERMARLRDLGVAPIVGLLHHGSGPAWTDLLDPELPAMQAGFAHKVAERYPDVDAYTPVNEPLTTARFSGLYGVWYPHRRDDAGFVRALLNQMEAVRRCMQAIRRVRPDAQLVQTEDLGFICATPKLAYQARFENLRRWLSFDLLTGRVDPSHGLWDYLRANGATEAELRGFLDTPCPPGIVGINHYVTSERLLDERVEHYPAERIGGNGRHRYADVETVRAAGALVGGFGARLREASERYGLPVAVTEAHLGCTRDEQLRWLQQTWDSAQALRDAGHDVRAVTCWAAFGTFDWNSLVTRADGHYEPGLWDVRSDPPRETALAGLARRLAAAGRHDDPVVSGPGWWQRAERFAHPPHGVAEHRPAAGRELLITGATGTLGRAFARLCELRGLPHRLLTRAGMDITDAASVEAAFARWQPWAIVNTAGFVRVDEAESEPRQWRENVDGPVVLAQACQRHGVRLMGFSSDLVFDGGKSAPYVETDGPQPLNAYGRAKLESERRMLALAPDTLVIRTAAFFGPWDAYNFVTLALQALRRGEVWRAADDQHVSPTYVPDLVNAALDLLIDGEHGLWHLANQGAVSWARFAEMAAEVAGLDRALVQGQPGASLGQVARRPAFSALDSERARIMPRLEDGLLRYLNECEAALSGA